MATVVRRRTPSPSPPPPPFPVSLLRSKAAKQQQQQQPKMTNGGKSVAAVTASDEDETNNRDVPQQQQQQQQSCPLPNNNHHHHNQSSSSSWLGKPLSVTIVSAEPLPHYCSERFYLLSELDVRAHPTVFWHDNDHRADAAASVHTNETTTPGYDDDEKNENHPTNGEKEEEKHHPPAPSKEEATNNQGAASPNYSRFPLYTILYLLWKPEYPLDNHSHNNRNHNSTATDQSVVCSPQEFTETVILPAVHWWEQEWDQEQHARQQQQQQPQPSSSSLENRRQHCNASAGPQSRQRRRLSPESSTSQNHSTPSVSLEGSITTAVIPDDERRDESNDPSESKVSLEHSSPSSSASPSPPRPPLYLVVDRVDPAASTCSPRSHDDTQNMNQGPPPEEYHQQQFKVQETLAYELARLVASHPKLRHVCEGITIGVSNHRRAAPGLEACVDAVAVGAKDRRTMTSLGRPGGNRTNTSTTTTSSSLGTPQAAKKSLIGLVTLDHQTLLGVQYSVVPPQQHFSLHSHHSSSSSADHRLHPDGNNGIHHAIDSDAVTPSTATSTATATAASSPWHEMNHPHAILQTRICAEWNGRGNLMCFARRAHAAWRRQHGLPPQPEMYTKRKLLRRTSRPVSSSSPPLLRRPLHHHSSGVSRQQRRLSGVGDAAGTSSNQGRGRRRRPCVEYRRVDMGPPPGRRRHHSFLTDRAFAEFMWDVVAVLWISSYIGFHFFLVGNNHKLGWGWDLLFWIFYPSTWDDVVQRLREW